ncbi:hypothetical protein HMPREF0185_01080 [Brevundimonas diminuta 470-4]|nr:hypothetical protein HMPREF0185_01080 [Brevundimonas diminuta 470-4]
MRATAASINAEAFVTPGYRRASDRIHRHSDASLAVQRPDFCVSP